MPANEHVKRWVDEVAKITKPDKVVWCDGSEAERKRLTAQAVESKELIELNQDKMPGCYLHRSNPTDVARTEHLTFVCTPEKDDAGPNNNWMAPKDAREKVTPLFDGAMKGRTMYVCPFIMGPAGSPYSKVGVEITDSIYVVLNMRIMTRMGEIAYEQLGDKGEFTRCWHSLGDLSPERRYIMHFPAENEIMSIGSGYGGNALLGKKCLALRIASYLGQKQGWLAEHMLIVGIQNPKGEVHYVTGAFPSACGKTNLAMLVPPPEYAKKGWKVWTVGDDIAWLHPGPDGRLWAINPEAGFFGVVPGTSSETNPNAMKTIAKNTIYTNVALKQDGTVWWEGHDDNPEDGMLDWQGMPYSLDSKGGPAAHPNSRFTAPAKQCPSISSEFDSPKGVPISAMLFGARRSDVIPLVFEATDWQHGAFLGATLGSETTAAATGKVGVFRRDPMAMKPFCGYNYADYFAHWLDVGAKLSNPPKVYRVNWFRKNDQGKFLWPGFGENIRVLEWILERAAGGGKAEETFIGNIATVDAINRDGIDLTDTQMKQLLDVKPSEWADVVESQTKYFEQYGSRLPQGIQKEHDKLAERVKEA